MKKLSNFLMLIVLGSFLIAWIPSDMSNAKRNPKVRNIIFLIGDGMGVAALYAAMTVSDQPLNIERCPVSGLQKTFSSDNYITDSAAAGTAMASGKKTKNGVIGLDSQGNPAKSILDIAEEHGLATGMVAVTTITDATPASFVAHDASRSNAENIAKDFLNTGIDLFIGGGYDFFAKRSDKLNLIDSLKFRGYEIDTSMLMVSKTTAKKLAGLVYPNQVPYRLKGRGDMLPVASKKAIEILSKNRKGFFLMIEGSHIDHGGHDNDDAVLVDEVLDFDQAVGAALDFAQKDRHTLVVITADHETGGVTIVGGNTTAYS
jgi:alkaline phosphatase